MTNTCYRNPETGSAQRFFPAVVLILIGGYFLLRNLDIPGFEYVFRFWPALLIAFGLVKLVDSQYEGSRVFGGIVVVIGALLLARNFFLISFGIGAVWPLILIGAGIWMLYTRLSGSSDPRASWRTNVYGTQPVDLDRLNEHAVFGGGKRVVVSQKFTGGEVSALFGGFEIDLTRADLAGQSAVIEADAVFGGVEIKIPREWSVLIQGTGMFGGYSDSTMQPDPRQFPAPKQLILRGSAVFGGVDVKN